MQRRQIGRRTHRHHGARLLGQQLHGDAAQEGDVERLAYGEEATGGARRELAERVAEGDGRGEVVVDGKDAVEGERQGDEDGLRERGAGEGLLDERRLGDAVE